MENNLIKFVNILNSTNDKEFTLTGVDWVEGNFWIRAYPDRLIILDEEDIQYFANKYLPKLQEEMENKINKIKEEYGK